MTTGFFIFRKKEYFSVVFVLRGRRWITGTRKSELADGWFPVVTGHVMPFHSVGVKVVQDTDADLVAVTVVGLRLRHGLLSSSVGPEPLSPLVSLPLARGPGHSADGVIDPAASPEVTPPVTDGDSAEKQRLLVVVKGHSVASLKLAVLFSFVAGKVAALLVINLVRQDVWTTLLVKLVGASSWATIQGSLGFGITRGRGLCNGLLLLSDWLRGRPHNCLLLGPWLLLSQHWLLLPWGWEVWSPGG